MPASFTTTLPCSGVTFGKLALTSLHNLLSDMLWLGTCVMCGQRAMQSTDALNYCRWWLSGSHGLVSCIGKGGSPCWWRLDRRGKNWWGSEGLVSSGIFHLCLFFFLTSSRKKNSLPSTTLWLKTVCWGFINQICCQGFVSAPAIPCFLGGR